MSLEKQEILDKQEEISNNLVTDKKEKSFARRKKATIVLSILAFAVSILGYVLIESVGAFITLGSGFVSFLSIIPFLIIFIVPIIAILLIAGNLFLFIVNLTGLILSVVSMILNGKVKNHHSTVFSSVAMPISIISTASTFRAFMASLFVGLMLILFIVFLL